MRYFKAITTIMTVIFFASQPSLGFASRSKTHPKIVITVRTNIPWIPSAIMKAFKKWCFLKNHIKTGKGRGAVGRAMGSSWYLPEDLLYPHWSHHEGLCKLLVGGGHSETCRVTLHSVYQFY